MALHDRSNRALYDRSLYRAIPQIQLLGYLEQSTLCHPWDMGSSHLQWWNLAYIRSRSSSSEPDVRGRGDVTRRIRITLWRIFYDGVCISLSCEEVIKILTSRKIWYNNYVFERRNNELEINLLRKTPVTSGCFSVIDTDEGVSVCLDLSLSEWLSCIRRGYRDTWGGSPYNELVKG